MSMIKNAISRMREALGRAESHGERRLRPRPYDEANHEIEPDSGQQSEAARRTLERRRVQLEARVRALEMEAAVMTRQTGRRAHD